MTFDNFNYGYGQQGYNPNYSMRQFQRQDQIAPNNYQNNLMMNQQTIRIVENEMNVQNIDVPMDGNPYYFLKADGSEIYAKFWTKEMRTKINVYKLINDEEQANEQNNFEEMLKGYFSNMEGNICSKLDSLDERLNSLDKPITKQKAKEA